MTVQKIVDNAGKWDIPMNNAESWEGYFRHDECVSGDLEVETPDGLVRVRDVSAGQYIKGFNSDFEETWCKVESVNKNGRGILHGNYTKSHWLVVDGLVSHNGESGEKRVGDLYTVFTDCPAMASSDGTAFTPIADTFCGSVELSWADYITLFASISRVVAETGTFWFDVSKTYKDCSDTIGCRHARWKDALPEICSLTIHCAKTDDCDDTSIAIGDFMQHHVDPISAGVGERRNLDATIDAIVNAVRQPQASSYFWGVFGTK